MQSLRGRLMGGLDFMSPGAERLGVPVLTKGERGGLLAGGYTLFRSWLFSNGFEEGKRVAGGPELGARGVRKGDLNAEAPRFEIPMDRGVDPRIIGVCLGRDGPSFDGVENDGLGREVRGIGEALGGTVFESEERVLGGCLKVNGRKGRPCEPKPAEWKAGRDAGVDVGGAIAFRGRKGVKVLVWGGGVDTGGGTLFFVPDGEGEPAGGRTSIALRSSAGFVAPDSHSSAPSRSSQSASHSLSFARAFARAAAEGSKIPTFSFSGDPGAVF
jgi:hypothetical protein